MHIVNLKIDKKGDGGDYSLTLQDISIAKWLDDPDFRDGIVRNYITVNVEVPGQFRVALEKNNLIYDEIRNLKVTGRINNEDLYAIGDMPALTNLNLKETVIDNEGDAGDDMIPNKAFYECPLTHIVFPNYIKKIGDWAFSSTYLTGTVILPEGLESIGERAFYQDYQKASFKVVFPSTLKSIGSDAFSGNGGASPLRGELVFPDGLKEIGECAFENGMNIVGSLILPESLDKLGSSAFCGCNFRGNISIPANIKEIKGDCFGAPFDGTLQLNEKLETIGPLAFWVCRLKGEIIFPSTLREIGRRAFEYNEISSIVLPENLQLLGARAFAGCRYLRSDIDLPKHIVVVEEECFADCPLITTVKLHKGIVAVKDRAFENDINITNLICENPEPPVLSPSAFNNVQKQNITLEVPKGCVDAYRKAEGWRDFSRIAEQSNFVCRPAAACALNAEHRETLTLHAEGEWQIEHIPSWVAATPTSGKGKSAISLTISALPQGAAVRADSVVFKLKDADVRTYCSVSQYGYEHDEDEMVALQTHTKGSGIDIYFVGDGWNAEEIAADKYLSLCRQQMEYFFGLPPYDRLREYFNVYALMALSQESGINTMNLSANTKFGTVFSNGTSGGCSPEPPRFIPNDTDIFSYISTLTRHVRGEWFQEGDMWKTLVILIPNCTDYPSNTVYYGDGSTISVCPSSTRPYPNDTRGVVQHEAGGHGFGKLGDEGIERNRYAPEKILYEIQKYKWKGWYSNLSVVGSLHDVDWSELIFDLRYSDYVDVYEGGYGYTRSVWRSEANSCMNYGIPYYNAISRLDITRRVHDLAGEYFDIERDFYDVDTREWGPSNISRSSDISGLPKFIGGNAPTIAKRGQYDQLFKQNKNKKYER